MNHPTFKESSVPYENRSKDDSSKMPPPPKNRGLFGGAEVIKPSTTATATNFMMNNLTSANPPPQAQLHYPGNIRLGNNYISMPGVYWYTDVHPKNNGPFNIKGL